MKRYRLLVIHTTKNKAKRVTTKKPVATRINQYWGMDMTKIKLKHHWVYLHIVKDWYSKEIIGYHLSYNSYTSDWLEALNQAVNNRFLYGIEDAPYKPKLITDNGCQPTSKSFLQATKSLGIEQIFTSFNNPKGNADTERVMRTIKEDLVWIHDWQSYHDFEQALHDWIHRYNNDCPHMALNWKTPTQFYKNILLETA